MKNKYFYAISTIAVITALVFSFLNISPKLNVNDLRVKHENFLDNSPFSKTLKLSKKERKALGISPNKYFERDWELTMNPLTGKPEPEKKHKLQEELRQRLLSARVPGENTNDWVERGPNNVGGRTRALMYDPNDPTNRRVFAGAVSGGLWVNNNITDVNSVWTEVNIPQNLSITCITFDPNNTNIFYAGTGESYVQGDVNGNGVWRSTNAGTTWSRVFGGVSGETTFATSTQLTVNSPSVIAGDYQLVGAAFGPVLGTLSGNLALADDGTANPSLACSAITNGASINGNIAVIERGLCPFTTKVKNAQDQGAIGVLIVNNIAGPPTTLGGADGSITIPSAMISRAQGLAIINQLNSGSTVNVTMQSTTSVAFEGQFVTPGVQHINDIQVRDLGTTSEVYVAAGSSEFVESSPRSILGGEDYGLYKSTNEGSSWSRVSLPTTTGGVEYEPNDIELSVNNTIWLATKGNFNGIGGGVIFSSTNGTTFVEKKVIPNGARTEIAVSKTNDETVYVLGRVRTVSGNAFVAPFLYMSKTTDAFNSETLLSLPSDADTGIFDDDFTRGQAFYNLVIEVDPTNDNIIYAGGIDFFRSTNSGSSWSQISRWSRNNDLNDLNVPDVHADQHALVFNPSNPSQAIIGNDGGVYYASSLSSTPPAINNRERNYNTVQFYNGSIGQDQANERILGGSQDNGTLYANSANTGVNRFSDINRGGDGGFVFIDRDNQYVIASFTNNNYVLRNINNGGFRYTIDDDNGSGDFINPAALDSDLNLLFTNGTAGSSFQINRYTLGNTSATKDVLTDPLINRRPSAFKVSTFTSGTLFVGLEAGRVLKITDADDATPTFTDISSSDFFGSVSNIALGDTEDDIYVTFFNYGIESVFYTSDGGTTWENKEGNLPDFPVRAILSNPFNRNEVIVGTELGVWGTSNFNDANPNWTQAQNGMKDVKVTSFDLRTSDNTVLASTYGRGMFTGLFTEDGSTLSNETVSFNQKDAIKVYPTLSNGNFQISAPNGVGRSTVSIFDISGKTVYNDKLDFNNANTSEISLNTSSGLYIVRVVSQDNVATTHRIIIR
ncbi:PA domain-containing protein [uncultured Algibacter sp.]|uniref:PA domain-containing protein n=1 Tax=uncultured Algibacter sp. TaxID=298659 RepID=UPI003216A983